MFEFMRPSPLPDKPPRAKTTIAKKMALPLPKQCLNVSGRTRFRTNRLMFKPPRAKQIIAKKQVVALPLPKQMFEFVRPNPLPDK